MAAGGAAREYAPAQERPFERVVPVIAPTAETGDLSRSVKAGDGFAIRVEALAVEIGLQPPQRFAGEDVQLHRDQWPILRVENLVRLRRADQLVAEIVPRCVQRDDLRVLGEFVVDPGLI